MEPFSPIEIQLIKSSLDTKTDQELADLLDRSVEEVVQIINDLTNGAASDRSRDVEKYKQEELARKKAKRSGRQARTVKRDTELEAKQAKRAKDQVIGRAKTEALTSASRTREESRTYKTRQVDYSQMQLLRIDDKTQIYVKKGLSDREKEKFILQYQLREAERLTKFKKSE